MTGIPSSFLTEDVESWNADASYQHLEGIVSSFHVINDAAERAVKFGTDYNAILTKNEGVRQDLLQTVELSRRVFPKATRKCFLGEVSAASSTVEMMSKTKYDARDQL